MLQITASQMHIVFWIAVVYACILEGSDELTGRKLVHGMVMVGATLRLGPYLACLHVHFCPLTLLILIFT